MLRKAELSLEADSENYLGGSSDDMYYIGLDVHKKTISYCVKEAAGHVHPEVWHSGRKSQRRHSAILPASILSFFFFAAANRPTLFHSPDERSLREDSA